MPKPRLFKFFFFLCPFVIFFFVPVFCSASYPGAGAARNVLLISVDTLRPDRLSCYSERYLRTPHIDALASRGVLFERAFAHTPTTLASHTSILVGATPPYHGIHENANYVLSGDFLTLAEYLKEKGYSTGAFIGAFALDSRFGLSQGFDVYDESYSSKDASVFVYQERTADQVIQAAIGWLDKQESGWFSFVHIWDPHTPYKPPAPFDVQFEDDPYSGEAAYVDSALKKLFDYLESRGWFENTFVLLTADHGESLGEHGEATHGYFAYNSTLWIPLIIAGPGIKPGRVDDYVCHIDLFPTICDFLGLEKPSHLQGVSLLPVTKGKKLKKRSIYFESLVAYLSRGWAPLRGYLEEGKKYIESPLPEFYDLKNDFSEENNLAQETDLAPYKQKLRELTEELTFHGQGRNPRIFDTETRKRLRSLGYISSPEIRTRETKRPEDDLKTLLPFQQKKDTAAIMTENGRVAEAVKLLHDIIQERKDFVDAYVDLSRIYESRGLEKDALEILEKGLENNPDSYGIMVGCGSLLVKIGQLDRGIEFLQKALEKVDTDPDVWTQLGIAFTMKREYPEALESYKKALSLDMTNAFIYSNMGFLYYSIFLQTGKMEDNDRALECYRKAVEIDPQMASAYNGLGGAYKSRGQVDEAIQAWEKSLELDPDYGYSLYNLGVAYLQVGEKEKALKLFERYLFLNYKTLSIQERQDIQELIAKCRDR
jgi:arylsulfatase A-like enzyme/Flp pilus assembly protein TadD